MIQIRNQAIVTVNEEAAKKWLANGAQPTETVGKLLKVRPELKNSVIGGRIHERIGRNNCKSTC